MPFTLHKRKQGLVVRWCFFAIAIALTIFAAYRCFVGFPYSGTEARPEFWEWFYQELYKFTIPLVDITITITPKWLIAVGMAIGLTALVAYLTFVNMRVSEFLIDTESEMRKVSWPSRGEVADSSLVVIIVIIAMGVYLFAADIVLDKFIRWLIF